MLPDVPELPPPSRAWLSLWLMWLASGVGSIACCAGHGAGATTRMTVLALFVLAGVLLSVAADGHGPAGKPQHLPEGGSSARQRRLTVLLGTIGFASAMVPVIVLLWTHRHAVPAGSWIRHPIHDSRWLIVLYFTAVIGALVVAPLLSWALRAAGTRGRPAPGVTEPGRYPRGPSMSAGTVLWRAALAVVLATALFGPPWNVAWSTHSIVAHETLHWGGLQAIRWGYTPYVGPASVNYGPGAQLATYGYMSLTHQFTVSGFREAYALFTWLAVIAFCVVAFLSLPLGTAFLALATALVVSPIALWGWTGNGVINGFFGWGNLLRNIGGIVLVALVSAVVLRQRASKENWVVRGTLVGVVWGGLAYFAQENLFSGGLLIAILLLVTLPMGVLRVKDVLVVSLGVMAGALAVWVLILAWYASVGELQPFLHNYLMVPGRFMAGYANTPYRGGLAEPLGVAFVVSPVLCIALGAALLLAHRMSAVGSCPDRYVFVALAFVMAYLVNYPASLTRSDAPHFLATTFAVPLLFAATIHVLPRLAVGTWRRHGTVVLLIIGSFALCFLPTVASAPQRYAMLVAGRAKSFLVTGAPAFPAGAKVSEVEKRFGPIFSRTAYGRRDIPLFEELDDVVGEAPGLLFVDVRPNRKPVQYVYEGYLYFLADIHPGPFLMERTDMVSSAGDRLRFWRHLRENVHEFRWVATLDPHAREAEIFRSAYPDASVSTLTSGGVTLWTYIRP